MALAVVGLTSAVPAFAAENPFTKGIFASVVTCKDGDDRLFIQIELSDDLQAYSIAVKNGTSFSTKKSIISAFLKKEDRLQSFQSITFAYDGKTRLHSATISQPLFGDVKYVQINGSNWESHSSGGPFSGGSPEKVMAIDCTVSPVN